MKGNGGGGGGGKGPCPPSPGIRVFVLKLVVLLNSDGLPAPVLEDDAVGYSGWTEKLCGGNGGIEDAGGGGGCHCWE